jgi:hypothetical protein
VASTTTVAAAPPLPPPSTPPSTSKNDIYLGVGLMAVAIVLGALYYAYHRKGKR